MQKDDRKKPVDQILRIGQILGSTTGQEDPAIVAGGGRNRRSDINGPE
jgi:hypothetical protein